MNDNLNNNLNDMQNMEQNDYYNNDSYYTNDNYDNNYSDTTYEEKENKNGIWWKILLVILIILIIIFLLLKFCGNGGKKSKDELYAELTTKICDAAETYVKNNPNVLDTTEPGKTAIIKFNTLANSNLISAQIENPYYDGGLFSKGTQPKYYSMDNSVRLSVLNDGTLNCEMVDNANDVTAPELRLNGDSEITLALGTEFNDPGYTATDDYDGDISGRVAISGSVDSKKAGTYELTYTVQDSAGNVTTKKRKIIYKEYPNLEISLGSVLDSVTPQISLKGSNPYCMVKGTQYVEPGAVATDNVDGNITDRISVTNKVTGNLMGSFRVVYKVEDSSGNEVTAYRAVIVTTSCPEEENPSNVVNTRPTITLIGKTSVTINIGSDYIDLGASAYDKEDGDITSKIVTDTSVVNTKSAGIYKVIYRVTDSGGLTSTTTRTVTVKQAVSGNPVVRFSEDKKNVEVLVGKGNNLLIAAPKAVNENGVAVAVTTRIEDYTTKKAVSTIDWTKAGKYRVIYTAIHGNGSLKQTKSIVVTILNDDVTIGGKDAVNVTVRSDNCDINESDLVKGGVTFTTLSTKSPIVSLADHEGKACIIGTYDVTVEASIDNGPTTKKNITVYVVNGDVGQTPVGAPSKVTITGNTANPSNVYNTNNVWVGGTVTGITISFASTPASGSEIAHFEYSKDCSTVAGKVSKLSDTTGTLTWTEAGNASVCVRAVTTTNVAGPWSDPVKLLIDRTGPKVEFTHLWPDEENNWYNTPTLTVEYKATDSESGLDHFEYTYDDVKGKKAEDIVTYNEATGKLTVSEDTEPTRTELFVYVRAVDKAGNKGEWTAKPAYINIDTVKPNAPELTVIGDNTPVVRIQAKFIDGSSVRQSGFGKLIYTLDDGEEFEEYLEVITLPENDTNANVAKYVKVWAVDKAGNKGDNFSAKNVVIAPGVKVTGVELKNGGTKIEAGKQCTTSDIHPQGTFTLTATPIPSNASLKDVVWSVADAYIASVDADGKVTARNVGLTIIIAKIGTVSTSCTLNVVPQISSSVSESVGITYSIGDDSGGDKPDIEGSNNSYVVEDEKKLYYLKNPSTSKIEYFFTQDEATIRATELAKAYLGEKYTIPVYKKYDKIITNVSYSKTNGTAIEEIEDEQKKYYLKNPYTTKIEYFSTSDEATKRATELAKAYVGEKQTILIYNEVNGDIINVSDSKTAGTNIDVIKSAYYKLLNPSTKKWEYFKTKEEATEQAKSLALMSKQVVEVYTGGIDGVKVRSESYEKLTDGSILSTSTGSSDGSGTKQDYKVETLYSESGTTTWVNGGIVNSTAGTGYQATYCFQAGTKVLTVDGYKDIDKITVNDKVLSYNEEIKVNEYKNVSKVFVHNNVIDTMYSLVVNNNIVEASSNHSFYVKVGNNYEYIEAKNLKVGDLVMDSDGNYYPITNISSRIIHDNLYNIEVEGNHNYYVTTSRILVHNKL